MKREITWPNGRQSAAMLSVMLDAEFIWLSMDPRKYDTPKHRSMGEYGPRRGIARILRLLDEYQVKATFFTPAVFLLFFPSLILFPFSYLTIKKKLHTRFRIWSFGACQANITK